MKSNCDNIGGFTLVECMVAMVVLSVAAMGVLIPFSSAASVHAAGMRKTLACKIGSDLMEEVCATDYDSIIDRWEAYSEAEGHIKLTGGVGEFTGDAYKFFSRSVSCSTASIGSGSDSTTLGIWVIVSVDYQGREIVRLTTLVSE